MLNEVPEGWQKKQVEDICEVLDKFRVPLNSEERSSRKGTIPYWGANGIVDYIDEAIFDEPLLLMPEDGGAFSESSYTPICFKIDEPVWVNNHAHVLRVTQANREYVYQWFVNRDITDFVVGGTRTKLNQKALRSLPVFLPPPGEQKRIAEILSSVDKSIQATQAVIEQAERVKRGLMEELLTGGLGSEAIERGEVPAGWVVCSLGEAGHLYAGGTPNRKKTEFYEPAEIAWVKSGELRQGLITQTEEYISQLGLDKSSAKLVPANTPVLAMYGATAGEVGWLSTDAATNQAVLACEPKQGVDGKFFYYSLKNASQSLIARQQGGAQPNLSKSLISSFEIALPPLSEQRRIAGVLSDFDDFLVKHAATTEQKNCTKRGLMDDLLTGKVRTV